jgi:ribosomal protein S18 acetylase RimI-like enzyme
MEYLKISKGNLAILEKFLNRIEKGSLSFRYFESRPLKVISNHIVTLLLIDKGRQIAYGHLDKEDDIVWLGIAVADNERGKGYGKKMMKKLINEAVKNNIEEISLTVDKTNIVAIELYKGLGFSLKSENKLTYRFELKL